MVLKAKKMVSYDVGMMVSLAYLHLFRMNVKNAKNPVRRNVFSLFMIVAVTTIRAIFTDKCTDSYTVAMELSHAWPILSIPYIVVNRYKLSKVFKQGGVIHGTLKPYYKRYDWLIGIICVDIIFQTAIHLTYVWADQQKIEKTILYIHSVILLFEHYILVGFLKMNKVTDKYYFQNQPTCMIKVSPEY